MYVYHSFFFYISDNFDRAGRKYTQRLQCTELETRETETLLEKDVCTPDEDYFEIREMVPIIRLTSIMQ